VHGASRHHLTGALAGHSDLHVRRGEWQPPVPLVSSRRPIEAAAAGLDDLEAGPAPRTL
jgi:hypothetical protein